MERYQCYHNNHMRGVRSTSHILQLCYAERLGGAQFCLVFFDDFFFSTTDCTVTIVTIPVGLLTELHSEEERR